MKKILSFFVAISLLFVLVSCNDKNDDFVSKIEKDIGQTQTNEEKNINPLGFENTKLYSAVCEALGKEPTKVTREDILNIKYLAIGPESTGVYTVYVGLSDYMDAYFEVVKHPDDEEISKKLVSLVKVAPFDVDKQNDVFSDIAKFTKVNVFEYYDIPVSDVSFLKNLDELYYGYFNNNGIEDVSCLKDYNPKNLRELDFTGNDIKDWTPLEHLKEKIIVHYEMQEYDNGNGEKIQMPFVLTLSDKLEQDKEREEKEKNQQSDKEQQTTSFVDKEGNPVDFGSLFE